MHLLAYLMQANGSSSAQDPQSFWTNISCMIASVQKNPKNNFLYTTNRIIFVFIAPALQCVPLAHLEVSTVHFGPLAHGQEMR